MIGKEILHYKILEKLGEGGMGIVYLAEDSKLKRKVAIKFLPPHIAGNGNEKRRFEIEAQAAAALNHPNIATIYAIEHANHDVFMVMEYIPGQTLQDKITADYPLSAADSIGIATQVASGLQAAHEKGIVHRDIKSANIMITEKGQVKIMDFGLAKLKDAPKMTKSGSTVGTPAYMSPEQVQGHVLDARSDIFSFGVVLYELLAGKLPFTGDYEAAIMYEIMNEPPRPVESFRSDVPKKLIRLVNRSLEKDPNDRYQSVSDLIADLRNLEKPDSGVSSQQLTDTRENSGDQLASRLSGDLAAVQKNRSRLPFILAAILIVSIFAVVAIIFIPEKENPAGERIAVAVADFVNQTGETELDGLSGMLITALEQSRRLAVVTRSRMFDILDQMQRSDVDRIDESLGLQICRQANISAMVVASIRKFGELYTIDLKVVAPDKNEYLFTAREEAEGQENIPGLLDNLSEKTRVGLQERITQVKETSQKIASITTTNLEAYQHYFLGEQFISRLKFDQAIREFKEAISLDSTFALAFYRLGYAYDWRNRRKLAEESLDKALNMIDRIPEKEQYLLHAQKAHIEGGYQSTLRVLEKAIEKYPDDKEIIYNYGDALYHEGRYEAAANYLESVLTMDPGHERALDHIILVFRALKSYDRAIAYGRQYIEQTHNAKAYANLGSSYIYARRFDEALETYDAGVEIYPEDAELLLGIGRIYGFQRKFVTAENYFKSLIGEEKATSLRIGGYRQLSDLYAHQGKYIQSSRMYDEMIELHRRENNKHFKADWTALKAYFLFWGSGKMAPLLEEVEKIIKSDNPGCQTFNITLALIYLNLDQSEKAFTLSQEYLNTDYRILVRAQEYYNAGDWRNAVNEYKRFGHIDIDPLSRYELAECYMELGEWQKAVEETIVTREMYSGFGWWITYPKTFYLMGKIYEKKGDISQAADNYKKFLELWKDADGDLPDRIDAKKRLTGLKGLL